MRTTITSMASQQVKQLQPICLACVEQTQAGEAAQVFVYSLKTDKAKFALAADGRVYIDGKEIYAITDGKHRLQGAIIELN